MQKRPLIGCPVVKRNKDQKQVLLPTGLKKIMTGCSLYDFTFMDFIKSHLPKCYLQCLYFRNYFAISYNRTFLPQQELSFYLEHTILSFYYLDRVKIFCNIYISSHSLNVGTKDLPNNNILFLCTCMS